MTRPLRIEYTGALYHITSRGNKKEPIFLSDSDRILFLKILEKTIFKHNWLCYSYSLMDNHYHLLIETPDGNLSSGIRDLNGIYTQSFNKKNKTVGHLLQGRFKSFLIEKETYLLEVARYIVLNPVRAGLVDHPKDWLWSSYRATAGIDIAPRFLTTDYILGMFSENLKEAQQKYKKFVKKGIKESSPFDQINEGKILGSPQFIHEAWEKSGNTDQIKEIPRSDRIIGRPSLDEIFVDIQSKQKRNELILFSSIRCGYSNTDIAKKLNITPAAVSVIIKKLRFKT